MIYYVNGKAKKDGTGTKAAPFKTINEAAAVARAGDEVIVRSTEEPRIKGSPTDPKSHWAQ